MSVCPVLPVELFHEVLYNLRDDLSTLKQCALVCRTLRYIVQQHLFSELILHRFPQPRRNEEGREQEQEREEEEEETLSSYLLKPAHSHLLSHIRQLTLQCYPPAGHQRQSSITTSTSTSTLTTSSTTTSTTTTTAATPDPSFLSVLNLLPAHNLHKITLLRRYRDDPSPDTEAIVRGVLQRSTSLEELNIEDRRVPASYLMACAPSIRVLKVHGTEFVEDVGGNEGCQQGYVGGGGVVMQWPRLEALVFPLRMLPGCLLWMSMGRCSTGAGSTSSGGGGGGTAIFPRLKHLLIGDEVKSVEVVDGVLDMCKSTLQSLVYTPYGYNFSSYPKPRYNQNGSKMELSIPPSLRMLAINCPIMLKPASRTYPNPFGWLNHTFRRLSSKQPCFLQVVHIKFLTTSQIEKLDALFPGGFPVDVCFHEFDSLLSDRMRFPFLKKVYLTVGRHYLSLFADPRTLPLLNESGVLGIIYEEVSVGRRFWDYGSKTCVKDLPWDGKTYSFSSV